MYKNILAALLVLMMGSFMTGCYFDPFHDSGYRNSGHHDNDDRKHEKKHKDHD